MADRLYKFDNLKAILIFLVVFGHFLELTKGHELLYLLIYSFHMPLFIFVTGYFARFDRKIIMLRLVCPYVVFQVLYTLFEKYVLGKDTLALTLLRPRWLLWYLFAMIVYYLLIPFFDMRGGDGKMGKEKKFAAVLVMVAAALLSGYDAKAGYDFSAARIFSFMPFFFAGYYMASGKSLVAFMDRNYKTSYFIRIAVSFSVIALMVWTLGLGIISKEMLYGSCSYKAAGYNALLRLVVLVFAALWIVIALMFTPDMKIPVVSAVGQCTMPVYLLHGFIVKLVEKYCAERSGKLPIIYALFLSAAVVLFLGNKFTKRVFEFLFWKGRIIQ